MASDSFTNTDGTALSTHNSNWVRFSGALNATIRSNGVGIAAYETSGYVYTGSNGNVSEVLAAAFVSGGIVSVRPIVRRSTGNSGYMAYMRLPDGGNWTRVDLYKNGSWTAVLASGTWSQSSTWTIRLTATGTSTTTLQLSINGSNVGSAYNDSSSPLTSGESGLEIGTDAIGNVIMGDDWTDGDAAAATSLVIPTRAAIQSILTR